MFPYLCTYSSGEGQLQNTTLATLHLGPQSTEASGFCQERLAGRVSRPVRNAQEAALHKRDSTLHCLFLHALLVHLTDRGSISVCLRVYVEGWPHRDLVSQGFAGLLHRHTTAYRTVWGALGRLSRHPQHPTPARPLSTAQTALMPTRVSRGPSRVRSLPACRCQVFPGRQKDAGHPGEHRASGVRGQGPSAASRDSVPGRMGPDAAGGPIPTTSEWPASTEKEGSGVYGGLLSQQTSRHRLQDRWKSCTDEGAPCLWQQVTSLPPET